MTPARAARSRRGGRPRARAPAPRTDALAVRLHGYAETSAVIVLLTADQGKVHAVAKGAKRLKNSFQGPLDRGVLYAVRVGRRGGEGLHHLHSSRVKEAFPRLRREPARFLAAALVLEVASDLMREGEPHPELFRLSAFTLKVLDRAPRDRLELAAAFFLARAVALSGHVPETEVSVVSGAPIPEGVRPLLSPERGGVLLPAEGRGDASARAVAPAVLDLLRTLWHTPSARILELEPPRDRLRTLRILLAGWLEHVLERRFRAVAAAEREFAARRG